MVQRGNSLFKVTADKVAPGKKITTVDVETVNTRPTVVVNPFTDDFPGTTQQDANWFLYDRTLETSNVSVGPNPPNTRVEGDLWWSTLEGNLFIWYNDGDSAQWVDASPAFVDIDYERLEDYLDQSVLDNAVSQIKPDGIITVDPSGGKGVVTIGADTSAIDQEIADLKLDQQRQDDEIALRVTITDFETDQQRQDDEIQRLLGIINDLADRLDKLEDQVNNVKTIDGGYPNAEGVFDQPESEWVDGGNGVNDPQTPMDPIADGGDNNAEGYD